MAVYRMGRDMLAAAHFPPVSDVAGLFVLSLLAAAEECYLLSALLFAVLLNMKHIFLYASPAFFCFLLRRYCRCGVGPAECVH